MKTLSFLFQTAAENFWREKWINALTVLTIAVGLFIISTFALIILNVDVTLKQWSKGFGLVVYLNDSLTAEEEGIIKKYLKQDTDILEINYISKDQALKELKQSLGAMNPVLEGFEENPLPASFELKLKREALEPFLIKKKVGQIKQITGVADVQYGEKWLSSLNSLSEGMKIIGIILGSIIFVAITFVTYSTIKILFYRRAEEIETLKLLGASRGFIRLPFLIEGLFIGILSGIMVLFTLLSLYAFTTSRITELIPAVKAFTTFFPPETYPLLPLGGAAISLIGSIFAIGRIRY